MTHLHLSLQPENDRIFGDFAVPEPFKNSFNPSVVQNMAVCLARHAPGFDQDGFIAQSTADFDALELKQRSNAIRDALITFLPKDFATACEVLVASLHPEHNSELTTSEIDGRGIRSWAIMPMADYVAAQGLEHFDLSMQTLRHMTSRFSSEFAVRPFIASDPDRAMTVAMNWAGDENYHVRRLASEGFRPRLPWGMRLDGFVADPAPLLPLLTALRDDPEEYVRRSVANNLNDIAKDHPDLVANTARDWMKDASTERQKLIRHACRSLIKNGHEATLKALGYGPAQVELDALTLTPETVIFGTALEIEAKIASTAKTDQDLIIDYVIHHQKADGKTSPKVFKWKVVTLKAGKILTIKKVHKIKPITTRVYYPGLHRVEIQVNGAVLGGADFTLEMGSEA